MMFFQVKKRQYLLFTHYYCNLTNNEVSNLAKLQRDGIILARILTRISYSIYH